MSGADKKVPSFLPTQALVVTVGPFQGRICENDDEEFLERNDFSRAEIQAYDRAGVRWRLLRSEDDEDFEMLGVDCEVVTFGRYMYCRGYHCVPRQFLRPATMWDLVQRHQEISNIATDYAWSTEKRRNYTHLADLLLEQAYISDEIWKRDVKARTTKPTPASVFLCHASVDKPFVRHVMADLVKAGHRAWIDEFEIKVGDSIVQKIGDATQATDGIVLFMSKASNESAWAKKEWQSALARYLHDASVRLFPVLIEDVTVPAILADIKYADFRHSYRDGLESLLGAISAHKRGKRTRSKSKQQSKISP